jgi:hypothetical protein
VATDPSAVVRSPYELALDGLRIQVQALSVARAKLFGMLIGGAPNEGEINSRIAEVKTSIALKDKEISALRQRGNVSAGPSQAQIDALRANVTALEQMNATAQALKQIMTATLNIADAVLYSPKADTGGGRLAADDAVAGASVGALVAAATGGAIVALAALALARGTDR